MAKKDTASKLLRSLEAEKQTFRKRIENADTVLGKGKGDAPSDDGADKVVRDTFSMPGAEYDVIAEIKDRCLEKKVVVNKSQVVRAGLALLQSVSDRELLDVIGKLTKVKAGRPAARRVAAR
ncbi:MAG TPA: hypothetical protein VD835_02235 [Pyrinomonadaceae bacterium]|nr:hypothetical protein [Pyrinomonadaceae bacterium]